MARLTVWEFDGAEGAEAAAATLVALAHEHAGLIDDAATVSWADGERRPRTRRLDSLPGSGALGDAFWGLLFGLVFYLPLLGAAIGAATGAFSGSLSGVGIDHVFINRARDRITPGTSALFLMSSGHVPDLVVDALEGHAPAELAFADLGPEQEHALRVVFAD